MAHESLIQQLKEQVSLILDNYVLVSETGTEDDSRPREWPDIKWWGMFQALFVNNVMSSTWADEDDMLFAVFRKPMSNKPFVAMRRVPGVLPQELMYGSDMYNTIDWKSTVLLNLAMHARFQLTLTIGGHDEIVTALETGSLVSTDASPEAATSCVIPSPAGTEHGAQPTTKQLQRRSFRIHPRLSRIPVDSSGRYVKVSEPDVTFPYLAFSVDDFDDEQLEPLVLQHETDEFAVVLHAEGRQWCLPVPASPAVPSRCACCAVQAEAWPPKPTHALASESAGPSPAAAGTAAGSAAAAASAAPTAPSVSCNHCAAETAPDDGRAADAGLTPGAPLEAAAAEVDAQHGAEHAAARHDAQQNASMSPGAQDTSEADDSSDRGGGGPDPAQRLVCMFRGYVDHGQVHETIRRRQPSSFLSALTLSTPAAAGAADAAAADASAPGKPRPGHTPKAPRPRSYFLRMNGPRGRGRAEVAINPRPPVAAGHAAAPGGDAAAAAPGATPDDSSASAAAEPQQAQRAGGVAPSDDQEVPPSRGESARGGAESAQDGRGSDGGSGSAASGRRRSTQQRGLLGSVASAARALGRAMAGPAAAEAAPPPQQYECRFICLMLAIEDVVTALLDLHSV